jgi:hypothetical protein
MKKDVWQKTSNEMELQSFQFSWQQCEQKWKNLTKTYRDTLITTGSQEMTERNANILRSYKIAMAIGQMFNQSVPWI